MLINVNSISNHKSGQLKMAYIVDDNYQDNRSLFLTFIPAFATFQNLEFDQIEEAQRKNIYNWEGRISMKLTIKDVIMINNALSMEKSKDIIITHGDRPGQNKQELIISKPEGNFVGAISVVKYDPENNLLAEIYLDLALFEDTSAVNITNEKDEEASVFIPNSFCNFRNILKRSRKILNVTCIKFD